jgi:hypothetical protein
MDQVNNKSKQGNQPTAKEEWTEEQLEEGLNQLKLLHIKASPPRPGICGRNFVANTYRRAAVPSITNYVASHA